MTTAVPFSIMTEPKTPIWLSVRLAAGNPNLQTMKVNRAMVAVAVAVGVVAVAVVGLSHRQLQLPATKQTSNQ
jgi:hypothetical protein